MPQFVACARSEVKRGSAEHRRIADEILDGLYPTIHGRAAAAVFYDLNGFDLDPPSVDEAVDLVVAVAAGHLDLSALQVKPQAACG